MKNVGRRAKIGQRLQDERREGHVSGVGRHAQQSDLWDRNEHPHPRTEPATQPAARPINQSLTEWLSMVSEAQNTYLSLL